jgi:Zn-dependent membrane protease YugP
MVILYISVASFALAVILNLITLPVEYNASRRALKILENDGYLQQEEVEGAREVLSAAALTYVAALIVAILNLLRFVLAFLVRDRD